MKVQSLVGLAAVLSAASLIPAQSTLSSGDPERVESDYFRVERAVEEWRKDHGDSWRIVHDRTTGQGRFLYGGAAQSPFVPITDADFFEVGRWAVEAAAAVHGVESATLVEDRVLFLPLAALGSSDKTTVSFRQSVNDVDVIDGSVNVLFAADGSVLSIDSTALPELDDFATRPGYGAAQARTMALSNFQRVTGTAASVVTAPTLRIFKATAADGKRVEPRLVWEVETSFVADGVEPEGYRMRFDARSGDLIDSQSTVHYFDVSGTIQSLATPGTAPDGSGNPEVTINMPHMTVSSSQGNAVTDSNGNFTIVGANAPLSVTVTYDGTYVATNNSGGTDYSLSTTLNSASGNVVLMNPSAATLTTAEANSFNWIGQMRDWTRAVNPADSNSDFLATSNVNINSTCNAFYNGISVNFYQAGGGCVNTAYSSVVIHEMGHWMNDRYSSGNGSDGFGEGNADNFATYILDDPIVGLDFCGNGCNIRDANNTRQYCGDGNGGCYGQVHTDGEVLMGACWKVRSRLKAALGTTAGGAIADGLFNGWMNAYNQTTIDSIIETQWLTLDDNNGNINDGTPNYPHIDGGFRDQGFPGVDVALLSITNVTQLPDTQDQVGPYTVTADVSAIAAPPVNSVDLVYSVNGGASLSVPMLLVSGDTYSGDIPGQVDPSDVDYFVQATDNASNTDTSATLSFFVGTRSVFFSDDFESGTNGWTHVSNNGAQDDWQRSADVGATNGGFGQSGDPGPAVSGTNIWGNDLGPPGFNGAYQNGVNNSLLSPVINLSSASGTLLRFSRWLTIETGIFDQARVLVNGTEVWSNPTTGDLVDTAWVEMEIDISSVADGNPAVQLEWNLVTDGSVVFGGWNIDDVEVVTMGTPGPTVTADFVGSPVSGTAPLSVAFTDATSGNVDTWSWSFGDGGSSSAQNPSHTYTTAGTYTVSLTASGPDGSDTETKLAYVNVAEPAPVASFSGSPTSGTAPLSVSFSDASTGAVTSWSWSFGDGGTSAAQNPLHTYTASGTYDVSLTVSGPGGSDTATLSGYISVAEPPPVASFSGTPTSGTVPLAVSFSDSSTGVITSWAWTFGDGGTSALQNPSHTYTSSGTYDVSLTVSGPSGSDTQTLSGYITVNDSVPVASFSGSPTSGTVPLSVSFSDSSTGDITSWSWSFGDGGTSALQNPSHTYTASGTYDVSLTVSGPGGSDTATLFGYISVNDPAPVASFSGSPTSGTAPLAVNFSDASTGVITSWSWSFGDGGTSALQNPSHTYTDAGTYDVSLTVSGPGGSDTQTLFGYITVNDAPPVATFSASPTSGTAPLAVNFSDTSTGAITSWSWSFGDGGTSTAQNPVHTYTVAGTYDVSLTVTGPGGSDTDTQFGIVTVTAPPGGGTLYYLTFTTNTSVPGVGTVADEDVVSYDPATDTWALVFDGSDVGLSSTDVNALHVLDDGNLLLSITSSTFNVPGLIGGPSGDTIEDSDVIRFDFTSSGSSTSGTFTFLIDGSDVNLAANGEDIDGIYQFPNGDYALSSLGSTNVGVLRPRDEDVFLFSATSTGSSTSGSFSAYFDGSDVGFGGVSAHDLNAFTFDSAGDLLFSTVGTYAAAGGSGNDEDVSRFTGSFGSSTSGTASLLLDLSALGISTGEDLDGLSIVN